MTTPEQDADRAMERMLAGLDVRVPIPEGTLQDGDLLRLIIGDDAASRSNMPSRTPASTVALLEQMERWTPLPARTPMGSVRAVCVHPDRYDEMRERFPAPAAFAPWYAGVEIVTTTFTPKNRGVLLDAQRRMVGIIDFAQGGRCYFADTRPQHEPFAPPSFDFAPLEQEFRVSERYGRRPFWPVSTCAEPQPALETFEARRARRRRADKLARRARIKAENARRAGR